MLTPPRKFYTLQFPFFIYPNVSGGYLVHLECHNWR
ncbi:MAG: hypothetical protein DDT27_01134 [Dehalococcoidia bacterium]|nr:hypothetical protein [Chloroflexota bacterium]MBT9162575.1 hypothetical protein [Chloroflexota bacterium]